MRAGQEPILGPKAHTAFRLNEGERAKLVAISNDSNNHKDSQFLQFILDNHMVTEDRKGQYKIMFLDDNILQKAFQLKFEEVLKRQTDITIETPLHKK